MAEAARSGGPRAGTPLRLIAQNPETGPIPVTAAHAAEGLHVLLAVISASYQAVATGDVEILAAQAGLLRAARDSLQTAIGNIDIPRVRAFVVAGWRAAQLRDGETELFGHPAGDYRGRHQGQTRQRNILREAVLSWDPYRRTDAHDRLRRTTTGTRPV